MNIDDIRKQYPQYKDLSDQELAEGLHAKFYMDIPVGDFMKTVGVTPLGQPGNPTDAQKQVEGSSLKGAAEGAYNVAEKAVGDIAAGAYAFGVGSANKSGPAASQAFDDAQEVSSKLRFGPSAEQKTEGARQAVEGSVSSVVGAPVKAVNKGIDVVSKAGNLSPKADAKLRLAGDIGTNLAETAVLSKAGGKSSAPVVYAEATARDYVSRNTVLDWDSLSGDFKAKITDIAKDAKSLDKLNPKAVERQGLLHSLDKPVTTATKGQLTRDPLQSRSEQLIKATSAGDELRQMDIDSNKTLLDNLDILKKGTGSKAEGALQTGRSVQTNLRSQYAKDAKNVSNLYKEAEAAGETRAPVDVSPLREWSSNPIHNRNAPYVQQFITDMGAKERPHGEFQISVNDLEDLRKEAVANTKSSDGTTRYWAGQVIDKLDSMTKGIAGKKYQAAREARRNLGNEFERTDAVANLVQNKRMSNSRATALEATWNKTVKTGSLEDLQNVKTSLGKSKEGTQAWNDLRGQTIEYIKSKATGGASGLKNEAGDLNATWSGIKRAVDDIGQDKLKEMFGESTTKKINDVVEAAQILKTEAPTGVKGSPSIDKLMTLLDKIPIVGWTANVLKKASEIGKAGRVTRSAKESPVSPKNPSNLLKNISKAVPAIPALLQDQPP